MTSLEIFKTAAVAVVILSILIPWILAAVRGWQANRRRFPMYPLVELPGVSILIPAWNERTILGRCIGSVKGLTYTHFECIIIAGGADNTFQFAQELTANDPRFRVIPQRPGGKNKALNDGYRISTGNILVLLDADCEVEPGWLGALIAPLTYSASAACGNYHPNPITSISIQFVMNKISSYFLRGSTTLHGGAIALRRSVIDQLGGNFPETVWVGTDWDLNARLERLKVQKVFVPGARHRTPYPYTWPQFIRNEIRWRRALFFATLRTWRPDIKESISSVMVLVPYLIGALLVILPLIILLLFPVRPELSATLAWGLALYLVWASGRRLSQVIEVSAYTRDWRWLKWFWVPPATLLVSLFCCVAALISLRRISPHFQGYRPRASSR